MGFAGNNFYLGKQNKYLISIIPFIAKPTFSRNDWHYLQIRNQTFAVTYSDCAFATFRRIVCIAITAWRFFIHTRHKRCTVRFLDFDTRNNFETWEAFINSKSDITSLKVGIIYVAIYFWNVETNNCKFTCRKWLGISFMMTSQQISTYFRKYCST